MHLLMFSGAAIFLVLAFHPFVSYPISLVVIRWLFPRKVQDYKKYQGKYALVFCAYNEEHSLPSKIANVLALQAKYPDRLIQIGAYSDASSDGTAELLKQLNVVESLNVVIVGATRSGKSVGMNTLMDKISAEFVIFTDANVILDDGAFDAFDSAFADPEVGVACGHLCYTNSNTGTAAVGAEYWRIEEKIKSLESETGSVMGADGSIFAIRRELFKPVPEWIIDDFYTSMQILGRGNKIVQAKGAIAYERSVEKLGDENMRKVRIACRAMNCHRYLRSDRANFSFLNLYKYYSHKWLRWHMGFSLLATFICFSCGLFLVSSSLAAAFCGGFGALLFIAYLCFLFNIPVASKFWIVFMSIWSTAIGTIHSRRGKTFQTWKPAQSR